MISQKDELKNRVEAKQRELQARLSELKANTQQRSREELTRIETKLRELKDVLKEGWEDLSESTTRRINQWLKN